MKKDIAFTKDGKDILHYANFSIVMSKSRRLAYYTVVNIDGNKRVHLGRTGKWHLDTRLDNRYQCGNELYDENELDRGHLVRRQDPVWGTDASKANTGRLLLW